MDYGKSRRYHIARILNLIDPLSREAQEKILDAMMLLMETELSAYRSKLKKASVREITPFRVKQLVRKHTVQLKQDVWTSTGFTSEYLDGVAMLLDPDWVDAWRRYFEARVGQLWPVGGGASGALIVGLLGRGSVINVHKQHGLAVANVGRGSRGSQGGAGVAIVDDCSFTGTTIASIKRACDELGWAVVKTVTAWPYVSGELMEI